MGMLANQPALRQVESTREENRGKDVEEWKGQGSRDAILDVAAEVASNVASPKWLALPQRESKPKRAAPDFPEARYRDEHNVTLQHIILPIPVLFQRTPTPHRPASSRKPPDRLIACPVRHSAKKARRFAQTVRFTLRAARATLAKPLFVRPMFASGDDGSREGMTVRAPLSGPRT